MKCYVCKFANQAAEARRHPNPTTVATAKLLHKRMVDNRKLHGVFDHSCDHHQDSTNRQISLERAFKDLQAALKVVLP